MARLTAEMRTDAFLSAHPVIQGSYAHYSFVVIHPFADGNGRVARALASAFTYRAISMPIVILSEHRDDYLSALGASDAGDFQQFVDFMLARSLDTVVLVEESLRSATAPPAEQSAAAIERLYFTKGGYTYEQVDQFGERLLNAFNEAVIPLIQKGQNSKITFGTALTQMRYETPEAYRTPLWRAWSQPFAADGWTYRDSCQPCVRAVAPERCRRGGRCSTHIPTRCRGERCIHSPSGSANAEYLGYASNSYKYASRTACQRDVCGALEAK